MFKKIFYIFPALLMFNLVVAQKAQRFAYIDMGYILENIPEYNKAQDLLNTKIVTWKKIIAAKQEDIKQMRINLSNEKPLLTSDLIEERKEDIKIKEEELNDLQESYFGSKGDLFFYRKQLVQPIQDQVYNAIQTIAKRKRYDFVLNESSNLIMLYSNPKFDISELVLNIIVKGRKKKAIEEKRQNKFLDKKDKATKARIDAKKISREKRAEEKAELQKQIKESKERKQDERIKKHEENINKEQNKHQNETQDKTKDKTENK